MMKLKIDVFNVSVTFLSLEVICCLFRRAFFTYSSIIENAKQLSQLSLRLWNWKPMLLVFSWYSFQHEDSIISPWFQSIKSFFHVAPYTWPCVVKRKCKKIIRRNWGNWDRSIKCFGELQWKCFWKMLSWACFVACS